MQSNKPHLLYEIYFFQFVNFVFSELYEQLMDKRYKIFDFSLTVPYSLDKIKENERGVYSNDDSFCSYGKYI